MGEETLGWGVLPSICQTLPSGASVCQETVTCQKTVDASVWLGKRRPTTYEREERLKKGSKTSHTFAKKNDAATNKSELHLYTAVDDMYRQTAAPSERMCGKKNLVAELYYSIIPFL